MGDFAKPKGVVSEENLQGSPPLLHPASPKRTISESWTPPELGRAGVVEVPEFLCWSLRFTSCERAVPPWGLLSLGFSPTDTRGMGEKEPGNQPDVKQSQVERSGTFRAVMGFRVWLHCYFLQVSVSFSEKW